MTSPFFPSLKSRLVLPLWYPFKVLKALGVRSGDQHGDGVIRKSNQVGLLLIIVYFVHYYKWQVERKYTKNE